MRKKDNKKIKRMPAELHTHMYKHILVYTWGGKGSERGEGDGHGEKGGGKEKGERGGMGEVEGKRERE